MALIRQRRRDANRLGFAVHLAYLGFPGRVLGIEEVPPADMLAFIGSSDSACEPGDFDAYAQRSETRWEHLGEIQSICEFALSAAAISGLSRKIATTEAIGIGSWRRHRCRDDWNSPNLWHFVARADNLGTHRPGGSRSRPKAGPQESRRRISNQGRLLNWRR